MEASSSEVRNLKALLCQISPFHKDKKKTIDRVRASLKMYSEKSKLDIVLFPEIAFPGYNFKNHEDALPHAVEVNQGLDFDFAREIATRLKAYVGFGYIEKAEEGLYNSAAVVDREGNLVVNYRKTHLYYNDRLWSKEGSGFKHFDLTTTENRKVRCSLAICMDINPKDFTSDAYEVADYVVGSQSDVLLFLTNWVDSEKEELTNADIAATYNYWIHRLKPLILSKRTTLFLAADRVGVEYDEFAKKNTIFYGSSCAMMFNPSKILKNLDIKNEGYLLVETYLP
jgi:protein N-terminal amidase